MKKLQFLGVLAPATLVAALVLSLSVIGCKDDPPADPTVTGVTVSPSPATVAKNSTQQFSATVQGTNGPAQTVTWEIVGTVNAGTSINTSGLLTVATGEAASALTVKATSTYDTSKSGTSTVTLVAAGSTIRTFSGLTANGSSSSDTTKLTLTFDQAISGLTASNITITPSTAVTKGSLTNTAGVYELTVSNVVTSREITVGITGVSGTYVSPSSKTVTVYKAGTVAIPDSGTLTISGLGAYNGKFAWGYAGGNLKAGVAHSTGYYPVEISGGSVTLAVYKEVGATRTGYSGNDTVMFYIDIYATQSIGGTPFDSGTVSNVTFANGIGAGALD